MPNPPTGANPDVPTVDSIMSMVFEYAVARLMRNASTPTRNNRHYRWAQEEYARNVANCERLEREIRAALRHAGVPDQTLAS